MNNNTTLISFQGSSQDSTADLTTTNLQEPINNKIEHVCSLLNVIQSRVTSMVALYTEEDGARRSRMAQTSSYDDVTVLYEECKAKLDELWTAIGSVQTKTAGLRAAKFSIIGHELMANHRQLEAGASHRELAIPGMEQFIENIHNLGIQLVDVTEKLKKFYKEEENEVHKVTANQHRIVELNAEVVQHVENTSDTNEISEAEMQKIKRRYTNTKIAAAVINILLSKHPDIDFEENPELMEIKTKWRKLSQKINLK